MRKRYLHKSPSIQVGATLAEYLPLTSILLLVTTISATHYGHAIKGVAATLAERLTQPSSGLVVNRETATGSSGSDSGLNSSHDTDNEAPAAAGANDFGPYLTQFSQGFWRGAIDRFAVLTEFGNRHAVTAQQFTDVAAAFFLDPETMHVRLREQFPQSGDPGEIAAPAALAQWLARRASPADLAALAATARAQVDLAVALGPLASRCANAGAAAVTGCDTGAKAQDMAERIDAILIQVATADHELLATELDASAEIKLAMLDRPALALAWTTLQQAQYPLQERQSLARLEQTAALLEHPDLTASGFDETTIQALIKGNNGAGGADLAPLLAGLDALVAGDGRFENVAGLVRELELGGNFAVGARFVVRDMTANSAEFAGTSVTFETPQQAQRGVSHIDLVVESQAGLQLLEYTSVKAAPPPGFARAFASDLSSLNVTALEQLSWRFDSNKIGTLPRDDILAALARMELEDAVLAKFGVPDTAALVAQIGIQFDTIFALR